MNSRILSLKWYNTNVISFSFIFYSSCLSSQTKYLLILSLMHPLIIFSLTLSYSCTALPFLWVNTPNPLYHFYQTNSSIIYFYLHLPHRVFSFYLHLPHQFFFFFYYLHLPHWFFFFFFFKSPFPSPLVTNNKERIKNN